MGAGGWRVILQLLKEQSDKIESLGTAEVVRSLVITHKHLIKNGRTGDSMYWWKDELSILRREFLTTRRRFTFSKDDSLLHEAWKIAESALRQGIKKCRLQCW